MIAGLPLGRRWKDVEHPTRSSESQWSWSSLVSQTEQCVVARPVTFLVGAFVTGVALGWLIKRR
jgi:hypothetical protein